MTGTAHKNIKILHVDTNPIGYESTEDIYVANRLSTWPVINGPPVY